MRRVVRPQVVEEVDPRLAGEDHQPDARHPRRVVPESCRRPAGELLPGAVGVGRRPTGRRVHRFPIATAEQVRDLPVAIRGPGVILACRGAAPVAGGSIRRQPVGPMEGSTDGSTEAGADGEALADGLGLADCDGWQAASATAARPSPTSRGGSRGLAIAEERNLGTVYRPGVVAQEVTDDRRDLFRRGP